MLLPERGAKRICGSCGIKFYDMNKSPILCPKCGTEHDPLAGLKLKRSSVPANEPAKARPSAKPAVVADDDDLDDDDDDDEEDESLIEDTSDIGDDDDDLSEVREHIDGEDDDDRS